MSKDSFTPEEIEEIVKQAREINDLEERESFIKRACEENNFCIEKVKAHPALSDENSLHTKTTEDIDKKADTIFPPDVLNALKGDEESLIGKEVGGYIIKEKLGAGGMSNVFLGEKYIDGRYENFAIKIINKEFADRFFDKEWEKLKKIPQHQNLAKYFEKEFDEENDSYYIVLQYIYGLLITEYCEERKLSLPKRLDLFLEVCNAVTFLHNTSPKIIHNDIKPSNIIVAHYPENPYLIDFGIAKFAKNISNKLYENTKDLVCSPLYASPELISNKRVSESSDIYSLGVVLYELLTSESPYELEKNEGSSWTDIVCNQIPEPAGNVVKKHNIKEIARNRDCDVTELVEFLERIDPIILKCLKKNPDDRYDTVKDLMESLSFFLKVWESEKLDRERKKLDREREKLDTAKTPKVDKPLIDENPSLRMNPAEIIASGGILSLLLLTATAIIHFSLNYMVTIGVLSIESPNAKADSPEGYFAQFIICLTSVIFITVYILTSLKEKVFKDTIVRDSFHQFLKGLLAVPITWFWLYLYYYLVLTSDPQRSENPIFKTAIDFLNACTSMAFLYLFLVMDMPSVSNVINTTRDRNFRNTRIIIVIIGCLIAVFAGIGRFNKNYELGVDASGLFAAVSMLYFFGRLGSHSILYFGKKLDSPYVNVKRWSLALLYAYGAVQVIGPKHILGIDAANYFILLLFFKFCLFSILIWWLLDGTFLRYFNQAPKYLETLDSVTNSK